MLFGERKRARSKSMTRTMRALLRGCGVRASFALVVRDLAGAHILVNQAVVAAALFIVALPTVALAQSSSPFDTGFRSLQTVFTGTVAKVASLIAIVIGGYQFAHGEPGAKRSAAVSAGRPPNETN
jgi:type IV secretory pathway VirB2 component (pilin)